MTSVPSPPAAGRTSPLALRAGGHEVVLLPADVNTLIAGMDRLVETVTAKLEHAAPADAEVPRRALEGVFTLRGLLEASTSRLTDPPVEITRETARVLRQVMGDLSGYQKSDLTRGLRELALAIERGFPM